MAKKYKDNIIPFPNKRKDYMEEKLKESKEVVEFMTNESVDTAVYMLDIMESELQYMQDSLFHRMDFRNPETPEARDMHAIVNLINAMFHRFVGLPHDLQRQLDTAFVRSKAMSAAKDSEFEIEFTPDFEFPPEDDNDNSWL